MSIIPQRKPDTPLMTFYTTGKYEKEVDRSLHRRAPAIPGYAATMNERNKRAYEEIDVKGVTQSKISKRYYIPNKYLKPFEEGQPDEYKDVSMNSLQYNRIINQKKSQEDRYGRKGSITKDQVPLGQQMSQSQFQDKKNNNSLGSSAELRLTNNGKMICEKILQVSKDEQEYFNNKKIFTKEDETNKSPYKKQIPDYFRIMENPQNQKKPEEISHDGMMTIVSKNQGWITVSPNEQNRKRPFEKNGQGGDATKTSILTPSWMQQNFPKNKSDTMKASVEKFGLRAENNRTFLCDKEQPQKSIFNYQHFRHNVHSKEMADLYGKQVQLQNEPARLIEWKENPSKQKYDKPLASKIGSLHDQYK